MPSNRIIDDHIELENIGSNTHAQIDTHITAHPNGTAAGQLFFWDGAALVHAETSELFWDDTNKRLGVGTSNPLYPLELHDGSNSLTFNPAANNISAGAGSDFSLSVNSQNVFRGLDGWINTWSDSESTTYFQTGRSSGSTAFSSFQGNKYKRLAFLVNSANGHGLLVTDNTTGNASLNGYFEIRQASGLRTDFLVDYDGSVGIATTSLTKILGIGGLEARNVGMERGTASNTAGFDLTINAGGATSAATDKDGGTLLLQSGVATGDGGSEIELQTVLESQGAGTADRALATRVKVDKTGALLIGDGGVTDYAEFASDGELTLHGDARVKREVWLNVAGLTAPGAKPATLVQHGIDVAWQFANAIEVNQESITGKIKVPLDMDRSVVPMGYISWSADGVSPGDCKWQAEYVWCSENEDTTASAQETITGVDTASSTSNGMIVSEITGVDAPSSTDECLSFRITRLSADASDTISDTVELIGVFLRYTSNKLGLSI